VRRDHGLEHFFLAAKVAPNEAELVHRLQLTTNGDGWGAISLHCRTYGQLGDPLHPQWNCTIKLRKPPSW
jgi:hypothetical protein